MCVCVFYVFTVSKKTKLNLSVCTVGLCDIRLTKIKFPDISAYLFYKILQTVICNFRVEKCSRMRSVIFAFIYNFGQRNHEFSSCYHIDLCTENYRVWKKSSLRSIKIVQCCVYWAWLESGFAIIWNKLTVIRNHVPLSLTLIRQEKYQRLSCRLPRPSLGPVGNDSENRVLQ